MIETVVPIGSVLLIAAISALAAYTGQQRIMLVVHIPLAVCLLHQVRKTGLKPSSYRGDLCKDNDLSLRHLSSQYAAPTPGGEAICLQ